MEDEAPFGWAAGMPALTTAAEHRAGGSSERHKRQTYRKERPKPAPVCMGHDGPFVKLLLRTLSWVKDQIWNQVIFYL